MGMRLLELLRNCGIYAVLKTTCRMTILKKQKKGVGQLGYNNLSKLNKMIKEKTQWVRNDNSMIKEIDDAVKNTCYMS